VEVKRGIRESPQGKFRLIAPKEKTILLFRPLNVGYEFERSFGRRFFVLVVGDFTDLSRPFLESRLRLRRMQLHDEDSFLDSINKE
jgi:hypothetical protein